MRMTKKGKESHSGTYSSEVSAVFITRKQLLEFTHFLQSLLRNLLFCLVQAVDRVRCQTAIDGKERVEVVQITSSLKRERKEKRKRRRRENKGMRTNKPQQTSRGYRITNPIETYRRNQNELFEVVGSLVQVFGGEDGGLNPGRDAVELVDHADNVRRAYVFVLLRPRLNERDKKREAK
jgi:hypothetical protein